MLEKYIPLGRVSRVLPQLGPDTLESVEQRLDQDGALFVQSLVPNFDNLNQEQDYYMYANPQGSPVSGPISASYSATAACFLLLKNTLPPGSNKRIHLDFIKFNVTTAPASGTNANYSLLIDSQERLSSGGSQVIPYQPNMDATATSIARLMLGTPTLTSATSTLKTIDSGLFRSVIPAIGDQVIFTFGSVEKIQNPILNRCHVGILYYRASACDSWRRAITSPVSVVRQ